MDCFIVLFINISFIIKQEKFKYFFFLIYFSVPSYASLLKYQDLIILAKKEKRRFKPNADKC